MSKVLIRDVLIIPMNPETPFLTKGDICIQGNKIVAAEEKAPPGWIADKIIDGTGQVALPGLINAHTHLAMTLFRGYADDMSLEEWLQTKIWPAEMKLQSEDVYWAALLGIAEMLKSGTTTFADMYFYMEETAKAVAESGIRASLCGVLLGFLPVADEMFQEALKFVKKYQGAAEGRINTRLGPHAIYTCPSEMLKRVREAASELGVGIHIHLSETKEEVENSKKEYGKTPVEHLSALGLLDHSVLAVHCVHLSEKDLEILREKKVAVVHNPGSNMKLGSGVAPVPKMLDLGITVALGTDGAASNNNLDMFEEMRLAALLHKVYTGDPTVISAYQALEMATRGGAKALGLEKEIGMIRPGMKADIILVDLNQPHLCPPHNIVSHLVYSARGSDVSTVIVNGEILVEEGKLAKLDEDKIMKQVWERSKRLL